MDYMLLCVWQALFLVMFLLMLLGVRGSVWGWKGIDTAPQHLVCRAVQSLHINHMQTGIIEVFICRRLHMNTSTILICIWLICRLCTALHTKCCGAVREVENRYRLGFGIGHPSVTYVSAHFLCPSSRSLCTCKILFATGFVSTGCSVSFLFIMNCKFRLFSLYMKM